jgi:hypothetical protein
VVGTQPKQRPQQGYLYAPAVVKACLFVVCGVSAVCCCVGCLGAQQWQQQAAAGMLCELAQCCGYPLAAACAAAGPGQHHDALHLLHCTSPTPHDAPWAWACRPALDNSMAGQAHMHTVLPMGQGAALPGRQRWALAGCVCVLCAWCCVWTGMCCSTLCRYTSAALAPPWAGGPCPAGGPPSSVRCRDKVHSTYHKSMLGDPVAGAAGAGAWVQVYTCSGACKCVWHGSNYTRQLCLCRAPQCDKGEGLASPAPV